MIYVHKASSITTVKILFKFVSKGYFQVVNTRSLKILADVQNNMDLKRQKFVATAVS